MKTSLKRAFEFFRENAGYCTPPGKLACALELARAEAWAREEGIDFDWETDQEPVDYQDAKGNWKQEEGEICSAYRPCGECGERRVVASLGGIAGATPEYRRVVEAELAMEAMGATV